MEGQKRTTRKWILCTTISDQGLPMESCVDGLGAEGGTGPLFSGTYCIHFFLQEMHQRVGFHFHMPCPN